MLNIFANIHAKWCKSFQTLAQSFGNYAYSIVLNDTLKCTINGGMKSWRTKLFFTTKYRVLGPFTVFKAVTYYHFV